MQVTPTITRFCHNTWQLDSKVLLSIQTPQQTFVVTKETPFHPVSHIWPDHPADRGLLDAHTVTDCQVGAVELENGKLFIGEEIPVKRDTPGWAFVVVHCLEGSEHDIQPGQMVELKVDKAYQDALSRGHSAGHIAYLALNKVLNENGYWRKDADRKDPHGHYDFNSYAQVTSFVTPDECHDTYRLGKTLRKRGLNSADVLANLASLQNLVNQQVVSWLELGSEISMDCHGEFLTDSRYWKCDFQEGEVAVIPCGGTHTQSLDEFETIQVQLRQLDEQNIEMLTQVKPK
ncbi:metal-dependent hydrolase [Vibrio nereis]|uniref:Metal-dependent hydrolase n=1 Tax=Vibrio nereis TaxID=693 RepID=A0A0M0HPL1_VIBNE|nr:metal-dependent hydrolase [Vibrio nereis]KOO03994.1 metal-dependent hydrolase [Vibrio nereis]